MLAEMGVSVWWPETAAAPVTEPPAAPAPQVPSGNELAAPGIAAHLPAASVASRTAEQGGGPRPALDRPRTASGDTETVRPVAVLGSRATGVEAMDWAALEAAAQDCQACTLCRTRRHVVFGVGHPSARWMIVGEAPGEREDLQGEPFVGPAGRLLDAMLRAIGVSRTGEGEAGAYVANVLKCRPPANRNPLPDEVAQCEPFLRRQVALVRPRIILAMGRFAVQSLLRTDEPIGRLRGRLHAYEGVPVVVTYHPAYLLRNLPDKAKAWADLCLARAVFESADTAA